jgi:hypothetical protein
VQDFALLKLNVANAFNSVSCTALCTYMDEWLPELSQWLMWSYAGPCPVYLPGGQQLLCHTGVQQGDPCPLLFSTTSITPA